MTKKTTVSALVDDELRRAVKVKAAKQDRTIAEVIRELLARWVSGNGQSADDKQKQG